MLALPDGNFAAFIFDCDGTLVDSMPLHYLAWVDSLQHHKAPYDFSEDLFYSYAGVRELDTVAQLNLRFGASLDPVSVMDMKSRLFNLRLTEVLEIGPVADIARAWHGRVPMAVASGSEAETVHSVLTNTGLIDLFQTIITPRDVERGKPAPDMFLLAAERMGVPPEQCLVFEDGQSGLDAAKAAGMQSVFVTRGLGRV